MHTPDRFDSAGEAHRRSSLADRSVHLRSIETEPTPAEKALRAYFDQRFAEPLPRAVLYLRLLPAALRQTAIYGRAAARASGRSLPALFADCLKTSVQAVFWPAGYYRFKLYEPDRRRVVKRFISARMSPQLLRSLNDRAEAAILDDKLRFAAACKAAGLPHVDTIAYFEDGRLVEANGGGTSVLPAANLFVKSTNLLCGRGVERWVFQPASGCYEHGGRSLSSQQLLEHVRLLSERGVDAPLWKRVAVRVPRLMTNGERSLQMPRPYIIQRELRNHPLVELFSNGALCTVRVVTARAAGGEPRPVTAALRMPTGTSRVDNFAAGGLAAPIDLESGLLGRAVYKDPRKADVARHPDSHARIEGEVLSLWAEAKALALRAHKRFPKIAAVGWDVALTTDGPRLLEANPIWCVEVVQMAHGMPLGETDLPALLMSHAS